MAISDSQFREWLKKPDAAREVLYEQDFGYESAGAPAEGTVYFSRLGKRTGPGDSPANVVYRSALRSAPGISRSVDPDPLGGFISVSVGQVEIDNADNRFGYLLDLILDGREGRFYVGDPSWPRADFRLLLTVIAEVASAPPGGKSIKIAVRDKRLFFDTDIAGDAVNDERRKPLVMSYVGSSKSVEPVEKDPLTLEYYVGTTNATVNDVFDNGESLDYGEAFSFSDTQVTVDAVNDLMTFTTPHGFEVDDVLQFGKILGVGEVQGLPADTQVWVIGSGFTTTAIKVSLTKNGSAINLTGETGTFTYSVNRKRYYTSGDQIQLSAPAAGRLLVDVGGYPPAPSDAGGGGANGKLIRAMLIAYAGLSLDEVDRASFEGVLASTNGAVLASSRAVLTRENLRQVIRDIAVVEQICIGEDHAGVLRAFRMDLSSLPTEAHDRELLQSDLTEHPSAENARQIVGTVAIRSQKNNTVSSYGEMGTLVDVATRRQLAAEYRVLAESTAPTGTSYATNWQGFHRTAVKKEVEGAFAAGEADSQTMADEILGDLKPHIRTITCETDLRAYDWLLGDCVRLTHELYGCESGKNLRLIGIETDLNKFRCTLKLIARFEPNTTRGNFQ